MRRLIYADEAIDYVNDLITVHRFYHPRSTTENFPISEVIAKINEVPTVDAVHVVRCKNCKYGEADDPDFPDQYFCHAHGCDWNEGDHFCSNGKEKAKDGSDVISINNGCIEMTLNSPITEEQLDAITDVDFEHTNRISFHTKHGKDVEFAKVVRCKDCKHWKKEDWNIYVCHHGNHADVNTETYGDWFCADGEKVTE